MRSYIVQVPQEVGLSGVSKAIHTAFSGISVRTNVEGHCVNVRVPSGASCGREAIEVVLAKNDVIGFQVTPQGRQHAPN